MKSKSLIVCIDANVYISAFAFGGKPERVIEYALTRKFSLVTSTPILNEVRRNLTGKLDFSDKDVTEIFRELLHVASIFEPQGNEQLIPHPKDNLVLETALISGSDVLVTGDKKDLLPLGKFRGVQIEPPSSFLRRLNKV